ncbi:MAG: tRNA pseudouridine synthase A [Bacteroidota bacterium]
MHTIRLKINDNVYKKVMGILNKFDKNQLEIIPESNDYAESKKYLDAELEEIIHEKATFISMEEVETRLEDRIKKHE